MKRISICLLFLTLAASAIAQGRVAEVVIRGNKNINQQAILATIRLKPGQTFDRETMEADRAAIQAMGYFSRVAATSEPLDGGARVIFDVVENPLIKEVRIIGNTVIPTADILAVLTNKAGQVLNINAIRGDQTRIMELYEKQSNIGRVEDYRPSADDAEILEIVIVELKIGQIRVRGNTKTRAGTILRELKSQPNSLFQADLWSRDLQRLYNLDYFESLEPEIDTPEPGVVDITLNVKEKPTGRINLGFAIDSRQRLVGLLELFETNFRGRGQTIGVNLQSTGGPAGASIELMYGEPWLDSRRTSMNVSVYDKLVYRFTSNFFGGGQVDPTQQQRYDERRRGVTLSFARPMGDSRTIGVGIRGEDVRTNQIATDNQTGFIRQDGSIVSATFRGILNTRDFDLDPAMGRYIAVAVEPGIADIRNVDPQFVNVVKLGQSTFVKGSFDYRIYFSPQGRRERPDDTRRVWAFRVNVGTLTGTVPFFEQFFVGGAETLRGYPEDRFWGKNMALASIEYRWPIQKAFTGVLFADAGDAWGGYPTVNNFTQKSDFSPNGAVGFGVRVRTPLGPIRIDYGIGRFGSRTHISIGQVF